MLMNTEGYLSALESVKQQIILAQQRAIAGANRELIVLYWNIGKLINDRKSWGDGFIENLARDIRSSFPNIRGFSERNLRYMSKFSSIYNDLQILQQVLQNLPWRHYVILMDKIKDGDERNWYLQSAIENGWSSNILAMQIDSDLYARQALADKTTNFNERLPAPQSDLAQQTLKDPYIFDFIEHRQGMAERDVENALVAHITNFLLELGTGFSFVGQQYHLEIGGRDFYIDLLFYHLKLKCYIKLPIEYANVLPTAEDIEKRIKL